MKVVWSPNPGPQTAFLASTVREVFYGGAVGGGKTEALKALPLYRCRNPLHQSILLRRTRKRCQEMIDRAKLMWRQLDPTGYWHETELRWKWSSGASTYFGYAEHEKDIEAYLSFEFDMVLFDELSEFTEHQYKFMMSRNRTKTEDLPPIMRSASNPGGEGMAWVENRFIETVAGFKYVPYKIYTRKIHVEGLGDLPMQQQYIPSTVFDNPKLPNKMEYIAGLADLGPELAQAYLYGRWGVFRGQYFPKGPRPVKPGLKEMDYYVIRCMDYGYGDPTAVYWLVCYPGKNIIEIAGEVYGAGMTVDSIAHMVKFTQKDIGIPDGKIVHSVLSPDAFRGGTDGGQSIATMLVDQGVWFNKANNDRVSGWAQLLKLINRNQLCVWEGRAPNLVRTLTKLPRDEKKRDDIRQTGSVEDHGPEALRYGCMAYRDYGGVTTEVEEKDNTERMDPFWDKIQKGLSGERGPEYIGGVIPWA